MSIPDTDSQEIQEIHKCEVCGASVRWIHTTWDMRGTQASFYHFETLDRHKHTHTAVEYDRVRDRKFPKSSEERSDP